MLLSILASNSIDKLAPILREASMAIILLRFSKSNTVPKRTEESLASLNANRLPAKHVILHS